MTLLHGSLSLAVLLAATVGCCSAVRQQQQGEEAIDTMQMEIDAQGSMCDGKMMAEMIRYFRLPFPAINACEEENEVGYESAAADADVLYIYPQEDHNGGFAFCRQGYIDPHLCFRLMSMARHFSVHFVRVASVQEAIAYVKALPSTMRLKHVVLGGHGIYRAMLWGNQSSESRSFMPVLHVDEQTAIEFLDVLYPHLIIDGADSHDKYHSTIFLDACSNGEPVKDKNMLNFVAHLLAGAEVFASQVKFNHGELVLDNYIHFSASITSKTTGKDEMISTMFGPHLRELEFHPSSFCKEKTPVAAENMKQCAELCQAAGTECGAFTYVPGEASGSSCFHSKRCESMGESDEGAMVFVKTASGQEEDPAIMEDHTAEER